IADSRFALIIFERKALLQAHDVLATTSTGEQAIRVTRRPSPLPQRRGQTTAWTPSCDNVTRVRAGSVSEEHQRTYGYVPYTLAGDEIREINGEPVLRPVCLKPFNDSWSVELIHIQFFHM
uniref:PDZ domain-containing protein n=1 Tax=Macrostomum lignano TaxID=282301 RepID=A0A1I8FRP4_9PLAT